MYFLRTLTSQVKEEALNGYYVFWRFLVERFVIVGAACFRSALDRDAYFIGCGVFYLDRYFRVIKALSRGTLVTNSASSYRRAWQSTSGRHA